MDSVAEKDFTSFQHIFPAFCFIVPRCLHCPKVIKQIHNFNLSMLSQVIPKGTTTRKHLYAIILKALFFKINLFFFTIFSIPCESFFCFQLFCPITRFLNQLAKYLNSNSPKSAILLDRIRTVVAH